MHSCTNTHHGLMAAAARAAALAAAAAIMGEVGLDKSRQAMADAGSALAASKSRAKPVSRASRVAAGEIEPTPPARRSLRVQGKGPDGKALPDDFKEPSSVSLSASTVFARPEGDVPCLASLEEADDQVCAERAVAAVAASWDSTQARGTLPAKLRIRPEHAMKVLPDRVYSVAMSPQACAGVGPVVWAGDKRGRLAAWTPMAASAPGMAAGADSESDAAAVWHLHERPINSIVLPSDAGSGKLMTSSYDGSVRMLDVAEGRAPEEAAATAAQRGLGATACWRELAECDDALCYGTCTSDARTLLLGTTRGSVLVLDARQLPAGGAPLAAAAAHSSAVATIQTHDAKVSCVDMNLDGVHVLTSGHDSSVAIWDVRRLSSRKRRAPGSTGTAGLLHRLAHGGNVTSAFFSDCGTGMVSTSNDDQLRVWQDRGWKAGDDPTCMISHYNHTGRWLSNFRAVFACGSSQQVVIGAMRTRALEVFDARSGKRKAAHVEPEVLTAVPTLNTTHRTLPVVASATASGRMYLWTE